MPVVVPLQIRNGLGQCRMQLRHNQDEIEACVADMAKSPAVDLTDELERLTVQGDALRRKLAMFENAATVAAESQHEEMFEMQANRLRERCEAASEAAVRRTRSAEKIDQFIEAFKLVKEEYDQADEQARVALFQAASASMPFEQLYRRNIDGSCQSSILEEIGNVLLRYHHEPPLAVASGAREIYVRSVIADLQRARPIDPAGV